jgi:acyl-CoA thioester hydrolase
MSRREEEPIPGIADFPHRLEIATRWMDNDVYGHVNNVVYYSYFDTVINEYLIRAGGLDIHASPVIGLCVESRCRYFSELAFPETIVACLRVKRLGRTSVTYEIGLFRRGADAPAAFGHFVHVFVGRASRKPAAIPAGIRAALQSIAISQGPAG